MKKPPTVQNSKLSNVTVDSDILKLLEAAEKITKISKEKILEQCLKQGIPEFKNQLHVKLTITNPSQVAKIERLAQIREVSVPQLLVDCALCEADRVIALTAEDYEKFSKLTRFNQQSYAALCD
jgi:hypothetical protein